MRIFDSGTGYDGKVNFVDERNVFLGYDMSQCCCENAGWFIADKITLEIVENQDKDIDLTDWVFDTEYFSYIDGDGDGSLYDGGMVVFKIVNYPNAAKFIHLYNVHNGYYGHGFEFKVGDEIKHEDTI